MKLLVDEDELVISVIRTALKCYAQQQRRPILGTNVHDFVLYYPNFDSLSPLDKIGSKEDLEGVDAKERVCHVK
ncbi:hypothetical protein G4B88_020739 [Cannabis sativa]|uniref:DUF7054 domain-containing protein n=1 Tax=Cannabis sativa TaxID=3483 RepID=A0A7J6HLH8_CANSA|nr:hypothetical protein G4B88_020739 [Cannabis sativa]